MGSFDSISKVLNDNLSFVSASLLERIFSITLAFSRSKSFNFRQTIGTLTPESSAIPVYSYTKIFFAFKAFNDLYKLSECVQTPNLENESLYICAAKDAKSGKKAILISNYSPARRNLKLDFSRNVESVFVIDYNYMFSEINTVLSGNKVLSMTPFSAYLIRIK